MPSLRTRNAALLCKIESSEGVLESLSASADGVLVENPSINFAPQNVETNEVTGSLDGRGPIPGGVQSTISFSVYLKGTGTPGGAPEWGKLMRACGFSETATSTLLTGTTFAVTGTNTITDSANGLAAFTVGTIIHLNSPANSSRELRVTASAAGSLTVTNVDGTAPALTNETSGVTFNLRRGIAGVAATAGTTTTFTGGAAWSSTAQAYRGMPVLIGGNPATPAFASIIDYTAGKIATLGDLFGSALTTSSVPSIPANVLYAPLSSGIPTLSMALYRDGVLYTFRAGRGTVSFEFQAAGTCKANFQFSALFVSKTDAAMPATVTYDGTRPGTFRNSTMKVKRAIAALDTLSLNVGGSLVFPGDPNQLDGFTVPEIVSRSNTGSINPLETLVATRDILGDFKAGTAQPIVARVTGGAAVAGNRIAMTVPSALYTGYSPGDRSGLATEEAPFFCQGQDAGFFLCVY
jgi:hypothetical protein